MEPLVHFTVPFVALTLVGVSPKKAIPLALLALLPDLDALLLVHRSVSHSLVVMAAVMVPLMLVAYRLRTWALAFFSLASHSFLDLFSGATPILWPLYDKAVDIQAALITHIGGSISFDANVKIWTEPINFSVGPSLDAPIFTGGGLVLSAVLISAVFFKFFRDLRLSPLSAVELLPNGAGGYERLNAGSSTGSLESVGGYGGVQPDDVTVVIPTLNEAGAIGLVLDELRQEGYRKVLVVDGYSRDGTDKIALSKGARVIYQHGFGKTGALMTAMEHVDTPYILVMDGDYTYNPKDIQKLLIHGRFYALVIGARDRRNISRLHRFGNWVITKTFNLLFGTGLSDVCSGMYLLNVKFARQIDLRSRGFSTEVEIAAQAAVEDRITQVPIEYRRRVGRGKLSTWRHGFSILASVIRLAQRYNPILLFSAIGASAIIPAIIILAFVVIRLLMFGVWHSGWALLGTMLLLFSAQFLALGTMAFMVKRVERRILQRIEGEKSLGG